MAQILNHALRENNKELGKGAGWLFTMLLLHADNSLICWPSDELLAQEGCGSQPTVQKRREWLIERGAIVPIPFDKRPENLKHLWHKKIIYQITGVMFIKNDPKSDDSTFKVIPTIFMTNDEQVESLTEQLKYLGFFDTYNLTEDVYPKVFLPKKLLGKESLAKETLYEVTTVTRSNSKASPETKVSGSVQPEAESPKEDKNDEGDESDDSSDDSQQSQQEKSLESLVSLGIPLTKAGADGDESATFLTAQPDEEDFSTAPPETTVVTTTGLSEFEWLEMWVKAILWTTSSVKLWKGFNKSKKHHGFGQQVGDAGTLRTAWDNFLELHPDNDELRELMPLDIIKDYYGFEKTQFPDGKPKKNGWLFNANGKAMKPDLTMGSAMLVRWFNEYLTHPQSMPYKKTQGKIEQQKKAQLASQAQAKAGLYNQPTEEDKEKTRKMFAKKD